MTEENQAVRSQRSFREHMATLYQNIDNLVYAAEQKCGEQLDCKDCPFVGNDNTVCIANEIRELIGERFYQLDIEILSDNTQAERKKNR